MSKALVEEVIKKWKEKVVQISGTRAEGCREEIKDYLYVQQSSMS